MYLLQFALRNFKYSRYRSDVMLLKDLMRPDQDWPSMDRHILLIASEASSIIGRFSLIVRRGNASPEEADTLIADCPVISDGVCLALSLNRRGSELNLITQVSLYVTPQTWIKSQFWRMRNPELAAMYQGASHL